MNCEKKRKSSADQPASGQDKKQKNTKNDDQGKPAGEDDSKQADEQEPRKPRLTTPDLEFDWDRAQLRDPRLTPGRKARPRYDDHNIPEDLKAHLLATREIPVPEKPKGRLNAFQKDDLFREECRLNPMEAFHHLYICYDKGPDGSPTYDRAGFQADYKKVANWMKPQRYSKKRMVNGMEKHLAAQKTEEERLFTLFFTKPPSDKDKHLTIKDYVIDHISKDLGILFHQISSKHAQQWRDKGFEPLDFDSWWKEPTAEERKRMGQLHSGSSLRKNL
ncbi:hypothetical protein IQ07DRAFT_646405 [Pyrenochaeta sp. DS3sAY3a]|nr:hypothetical protein IQ07DRAFT_646405 [Pyrenochaeta sp. DS3sAY3a]